MPAAPDLVTLERLMKNRWIAGLLGVACLGCCAPLILPLLAGGTLAAGAGVGLGVSLDQLICIGLPALGVLGLGAWWILKRRPKPSCACETACQVASCAPAPLAGPEAMGSCARPDANDDRTRP